MSHELSRRTVLQSGVVGIVGVAVGGRIGTRTAAADVPDNANTHATAASASASASSTYPTIDLQADCGAVGDGTTNDTAAFQLAAHLLQVAGGGTLTIPAATYIVGVQNHSDNNYPYWSTERIFSVVGLDELTIVGNNAIVRLADGIRYGSFDPDTGNPYTPGSMPFRDLNYAVTAGAMIDVEACRDVTITDLELDGNNENLIIGGGWGGSDIQLQGDGMVFISCVGVTVERISTHNHARDGVYVSWPDVLESDPSMAHTFRHIRSSYNGRQGMSWTGGRGLNVYNSQFYHSGRAVNVGTGAPVKSRPSKGLDIEPSGTIVRDGYFEKCEFINNAGIGAAGSNPNGGHATFKSCTFWGTTSYPIWCSAPQLKFVDCYIYGDCYHLYGSDDPNEATSFTGCYFEDKPWTDGNVYTGRGFLYVGVEADNEAGKNVNWQNCTFVANTGGSLGLYGSGSQTAANCTFTHKSATLASGSPQAILGGAELSGCHFEEDFPSGTTRTYYIECSNTTVDASPATVVDGPLVAWDSVGGATGTIPAGTYTS